MNSAQLLTHFDRISEVPDFIPSLRGFILDLAVRGKLVEQDQMDESASDLLKRLQAKKERLVSAGEIKRDKTLPPIAEDEIPFELPIGWAWERLGNIGDTNIGLTYSPQDVSHVGIPVLRSNNIQNGKLDFSDLVRVKCEPKQSVTVQKGDLLICARNGSRSLVGKVAVIEGLKEPAAFGAFMAIFRSEVNQYLYHFIRSALFRRMIDEVNTTTINQITQNNLRSTLAPIPPLAEQHRIVVKVDELMALCDRLEASEAERESRRDRLVAASLHRLNNGGHADEFREHARFYFNHLPRLATRPEHIQQLRQTIRNLAVRGKLVSQDPKDEPATESVKRIQEEKSRLIKEGSLRKQTPLPLVHEEETPFAIPPSWVWTRIGTCSLLTEYGTSVKSDHAENGVPVLKMGDIHTGQVILGGQKTVSRKIEDLPQLFLKRFDLLYNRTNSAELVGKTGIYLGDDDAYTFASYLIRIRFINVLTSPFYANLAMNAPFFRETQILPELKQQCGQANVNGTKLRSMVIPLPPLAEQHRIVAKVDELMALCDQLEAQLTITQNESRRLLEAVLHEALSG
jgi:type I restriction enzyme S subunit